MPKKAGSAPRTRPDSAVITVTVVLLEAGYASTAIGPIEVFYSAGLLWNMLHGKELKPRFRVQIASIDGGAITSLCALGLTPEFSIRDIKHTDIIILPASGLDVQEGIARDTHLLQWLRKWHARGAYLAAVCSAAAFLAETGLLDGKRATTHWAVASSLQRRYPKVNWQPENFVTEDNRLLCSGGVYGSIDLSLYLVEKFCGHEVAVQCAKSLLVSMPRSSQSGYAVVPLSRPHADDRIREIEEYMQQHFQRDLPIEHFAERASMGTRNFIRRFKAATGQLPRAYVQALRVTAAKQLLENGAASIQTVCAKIGYEDMAFFRNLFKRHTGMTPADYRAHFAGMGRQAGSSRKVDTARGNVSLPPTG